jgi:hypothetical protein
MTRIFTLVKLATGYKYVEGILARGGARSDAALSTLTVEKLAELGYK